MYQLFSFTMLLALTTNNMGILWVAMEAATLTTVLLVSLYRTPARLEAAWKYFILCGVGIAQALFGTILLYFAAERVLGHDGTALLWTHLTPVKGQLEPTVLSLAFVFLLVGYGTKVGLVPLHNWLPDAHAEGPTPVSAVLSGLLLNVALYAVVRCKVLVDGALHSALRRQPDDGLRPALGGGRRLLPVAAEGHQACRAACPSAAKSTSSVPPCNSWRAMAVLTATVVVPRPPLALVTMKTRARPEVVRARLRDAEKRVRASTMLSALALASRYSRAPARIAETMVSGRAISPMAKITISLVVFWMSSIA